MKRTVNRLLLPLLCAALLFTTAPCAMAAGVAAEGKCGDNVRWTLYENGLLKLSGQGRTDDNLYDHAPWEAYKNDITSLEVQEGVTWLGDSLFDGCGALTTVSLPDTLTGVGDWTFNECVSLTEATFPPNAVHIGTAAFYGCTALKEAVLPDKLTDVSPMLFENCRSLESITIPGGAANIGYDAFAGCRALTEANLPNSVTGIEYAAFSGCGSLLDLTVPDSVTVIGRLALNNTAWLDAQPDGVVYAGKVAYTYKGDMPENTAVTLAPGTRGIAAHAFDGQKNLTAFTAPDTVTEVGGQALAGTAWLNAQPEGVVYIGKVAYTYSGKMPQYAKLTLKDGICGVADYAFEDCVDLYSVRLPEGVTYIGDSAFAGCGILSEVYLPASLREVRDFAFRGVLETRPDGVAVLRTALQTVYYAGSEDQWAAVKIGTDNEPLLWAERAYGTPGVHAGDVDGDGSVTAADARLVLRAAVGLENLTNEQRGLADADKDGSLTAADARLVLRAAVGLDNL